MTGQEIKKHIRVLYLDDEENNLRSFRAAFRRYYTIFTAHTSEEAFRIVKEESPHVIFSDQRMPVTTGVEFFNALRQVFPDPIRILITGFTDVNAIIDAINKGHVYRYITKPWSDAEIRVATENAYDLFQTRVDLDHKVKELEKVNHELNRFIYSASHDLRAPLATILGLVRVGRLEVVDDTALEYFQKVEKSVQKLDLLVNHIIDYYKNSKSEEPYVQVDTKALIEDVLEQIRSDRGSFDAQVEVETHQTVPFVTDEFRLRIVLSHLLTNAIKFRKPHQEQAQVGVTFVCDDDLAELRIRDQGMGIIQEHLQKVFHMFFKAETDRGGSGLGLYIVREALDKMQGDISIESTPGEGTEFQIKLPNFYE